MGSCRPSAAGRQRPLCGGRTRDRSPYQWGYRYPILNTTTPRQDDDEECHDFDNEENPAKPLRYLMCQSQNYEGDGGANGWCNDVQMNLPAIRGRRTGSIAKIIPRPEKVSPWRNRQGRG